METITLRNVRTGHEFTIIAESWDDVVAWFSEHDANLDNYEVYAPDSWYEDLR